MLPGRLDELETPATPREADRVTEQLELRPARIGEAERIARMSRTLIEGGLAWRWKPRSIAAQIRDSETEVVVARAGNRIVGFAVMQYRFRQREAHLVLLAVEPSRRRRGIGRALLHWLEQMARLGRIERIRLEVRTSNGGGRAFYRSQGYREVSHLRGYYQQREDAVSMVSRLSPTGTRTA
jgi:ribosomal-protein-alanine N-acetyltransferase